MIGVKPSAILPALTLVVAGCGSHAATTIGSTSTPGTKAVQVRMINQSGSDAYAYAPATVKVHAGTQIIWSNQSSAPHTVTSIASPPAFDSGVQHLIQPGQHWAHTFSHPGTYRYACLIHPYMTATVVVMR